MYTLEGPQGNTFSFLWLSLGGAIALARLGYYHGAIDGIAGSETENAIRWLQSVDHLSVTSQIDGQTLQALGH